VIRLKDGESITYLCREFGISLKTGYKILNRYQERGLEGLTDLGWRPLPVCQPIAGADGSNHRRCHA
jgi:hypothetical protein